MVKSPWVLKSTVLFISLLSSLSQGASATSTKTATEPQLNITVRETGVGKTFASLLETAGFSKKDANRLLLDHVIPHKMHVNPHEKYLVVNDPSTHRTEARFYFDYSDEALVFWHDRTGAGISRKPIEFQVVKKTVEGKVRGSLIESIKKVITDDWAAFRFSDAFSWDLNLGKQLFQNDLYKFVIEEKYDEGKFVKYGEILSAELHTHGSTLHRLLWQDSATKVFVDPTTHFDDRPFYAPIDYLHISSSFTRRRFHPVRHNYQPHLGVDFALNEGSPVYAARDGVVSQVDHHKANGNFIMIHHDNDFTSTYNHLGSWAPGIVPGKKVLAGDIIGYVGCTGYCTSPHLDFRIRRGDYLYDPMYLTKPYPYKERNYYETTKFKELLGLLTSKN